MPQSLDPLAPPPVIDARRDPAGEGTRRGEPPVFVPRRFSFHRSAGLDQLPAPQLSTRFVEQGAEGAVFGHPAALLPVPTERATASSLLDLASRRALNAAIFDEHPPFFWQAEISSTRLDTYFTRMSPKTSLPNYAEDAARGVSFQNSHNWAELPLGRSLTGQFIGAQGNGVARTLSDFYTVRGMTLGRTSTDSFLVGVESGVIQDVSIGFTGGRFVCSICERDMLRDWDCPHIPGFYYAADDEDDDGWPVAADAEGARLATATIEDAHLSEVSAVYDGATPGAAVLKAYRQAEAGLLRASAVHIVEQRYRLHLPTARVQTPGARLPAPQEDAMPAPASGAERRESPPRSTETDIEVEVGSLDAIRAALNVAGAPTDRDCVSGISWLNAERQRLQPFERAATDLQARLSAATTELEQLRSTDSAARAAELEREVARLQPFEAAAARLAAAETELQELRPLRDEVEQLRPAAADGRQYRDDLIAEALSEGVRAYGQGFAKEVYEDVLKRSSLTVIKRMRDDWRVLGDAQFAGGRQTQDPAPAGDPAPVNDPPADPAPNGRPRRPVPNAAFTS